MKFLSTLLGHQGSRASFPILGDFTGLQHLATKHTEPHHRRTKACYDEHGRSRTHEDCVDDYNGLMGT